MAAARRVSGNHHEVDGRFAVRAMIQQPCIGLAAVPNAIHEPVFGHEPVINRKNGSIGNPGKTVGNRPVTARAASSPGTAVNIEHTSAGICPGRQYPFATWMILMPDVRFDIHAFTQAVQMVAEGDQPGFALQSAGGAPHVLDAFNDLIVGWVGGDFFDNPVLAVVLGEILYPEDQQCDQDNKSNGSEQNPEHGQSLGCETQGIGTTIVETALSI